jgi:AraC-like DNA-binding protein
MPCLWRFWKGEKMNYANSEMIERINELIHSERDRKILKKRLVDGLTYDELSLEFNLSTRQIQRIVYKQEKILFK